MAAAAVSHVPTVAKSSDGKLSVRAPTVCAATARHPHALRTSHHRFVRFRRPAPLLRVSRVTISRASPARRAGPVVGAFRNPPDAAHTAGEPLRRDVTARAASHSAPPSAARAAGEAASADESRQQQSRQKRSDLPESLSSMSSGIPEAYASDTQILRGEVEGYSALDEGEDWGFLWPSSTRRNYPRKRRSKPRPLPAAAEPAVSAVESPAAHISAVPSSAVQLSAVQSPTGLSISVETPRGKQPSVKAVAEVAARVRRERLKLQQARQREDAETEVTGGFDVPLPSSSLTPSPTSSARASSLSAPSAPRSSASAVLPPTSALTFPRPPTSTTSPLTPTTPLIFPPQPLPSSPPIAFLETSWEQRSSGQQQEGKQEGQSEGNAVGRVDRDEIERGGVKSVKRVAGLSLARRPMMLRGLGKAAPAVHVLKAAKSRRGGLVESEGEGEEEGRKERRKDAGGVEASLKRVRQQLSKGSKGGVQAARGMVEELLTQHLSDPRVQEHMALTERKAGSPAVARTWYQRSVQSFEALTAGRESKPPINSGEGLAEEQGFGVTAADGQLTVYHYQQKQHQQQQRPTEWHQETGHMRNPLRDHLSRCLQAWAGMEAEEGDMVTSRQLFAWSIAVAAEVAAEGKMASQEPESRQQLLQPRQLLQERSQLDGKKHRPERLHVGEGSLVIGLHAWAMAEKRAGNFSAARDLLERAEKLQPGSPVVLQSRALLEASVKNLNAARCYFKKATAAAPCDAASWQAWALLEARSGRVKQMRALFSKALAANPASIPTLHAWACQEARLATAESREEGRRLFGQCLAVQPGCVRALHAWAVMEHAAGNVDEARRLFEQCIQTAPNSVPALQAYARLEQQQGNLPQARSLLEVALSAQPDNAAALQLAGEVEEALGNKSLAHALFVRAHRVDRVASRRRRHMFESAKVVKRDAQGKKVMPQWVVGKMKKRVKSRVEGETSS